MKEVEYLIILILAIFAFITIILMANDLAGTNNDMQRLKNRIIVLETKMEIRGLA